MLTIENGSIVAGAVSYASAADLVAFAALRGEAVPATEAEQEALLIKAMDALQGRAWKGCRISDTQPLEWPRSGVTRDSQTLPSDQIPRELFYAQLSLALAAQTTTLQPIAEANAKGAVIEETVSGAVTLKYANNANVLPVAADARADALLRVLTHRAGLFAVRA